MNLLQPSRGNCVDIERKRTIRIIQILFMLFAKFLLSVEEVS